MVEVTHYLLPPLVKGRGTAEGGGRVATLQRAISLRQEAGCIAPYTKQYSVPLRLHPPVSFADSPPWQGGPRGLSNPANKAKAAHESAKRHYPHIIQTSTTKHKTSCRRQQQATTWRVRCDDRRILHESPEVQGAKCPGDTSIRSRRSHLIVLPHPPGAFLPAFPEKPERIKVASLWI